jgi:hypothetical protein
MIYKSLIKALAFILRLIPLPLDNLPVKIIVAGIFFVLEFPERR